MPEPILIAIAAAVAAKAAGGLYELVRTKFAGNQPAKGALEAATESTETPRIHELATELELAERADPEFGAQLRTEWHQTLVAQLPETGSVANQVSGNVTGKLVQARDISGDISL